MTLDRKFGFYFQQMPTMTFASTWLLQSLTPWKPVHGWFGCQTPFSGLQESVFILGSASIIYKEPTHVPRDVGPIP